MKIELQQTHYLTAKRGLSSFPCYHETISMLIPIDFQEFSPNCD